MTEFVRLGIIGLPNVGKSTLFSALTAADAETGDYPFTTKSYNTGVALMPDQRLHDLSRAMKAGQTIPAKINFVDVAGLVKGASRGEGLGNQFLGYVRDVTAIVHVVRLFQADLIAHVEGRIDPVDDMEIVQLELVLADAAIVEKVSQQLKKLMKSNPREAKGRLSLINRVAEALDRGDPVRSLSLTDDERSELSELNLITLKPVVYLANISEDDVGVETAEIVRVKQKAAAEGTTVVPVSARFEADIGELDADEAQSYRTEFGVERSGLEDLLRSCHELLDLVTFYTVESDITQAHTIRRGADAARAAGQIHTDMQEGFIKAEVVPAGELIEIGSFSAARDAGKVSVEGRDYVVKDGDVIRFHFRS